MGINVVVDGLKDIVGPRKNALSDDDLGSGNATRLFTALCGYRLVDLLALLGGTYPSATVVERTAAPEGPLLACIFTSRYQRELILDLVLPTYQQLGLAIEEVQKDVDQGRGTHRACLPKFWA